MSATPPRCRSRRTGGAGCWGAPGRGLVALPPKSDGYPLRDYVRHRPPDRSPCGMIICSMGGWEILSGHRRRLGGLMFYPRGGSAQVARYLSGALLESGWEIVLASGSLGSPGERTTRHLLRGAAGRGGGLHARSRALRAWWDQLAGPIPFHGSFEDRKEAPDPVFPALSPEQAEVQVSAWEGVLERAGFGDVDVVTFIT